MEGNQSLTPKQREVVDYIGAYTREHQYPPTVREIAQGVKSKYTYNVRKHLEALIEKGYVERTPNVSRGLKVVK